MRRLRPWLIVLILCLAYLAVVGFTYRNVLEFVRIGSHYDSTLYSRDAEGYDGQFAYYIARDPLSAARYLDVPAYRYQRILYPMLARLLSLGQVALLPYAMLSINVIALVAGTRLLEDLLTAEHTSRWYALSYGLFAGVFIAVRASTNEPLAYGLAIAAIWMGQRERVLWSGALFGLAALAKETTLFCAAGYIAYYLIQRHWRNALLLTISAVVPFALWQIYLHGWLGAWGVGSGGVMATPFEIIPFNGIWRLAEGGLSVFVLFGIVVIPAVMLPTLWALWRTVRDVLARRWHPYVFLLLANAAIMPFVPFSTYREPFGIFRFMPGLVLGVLLYAALRRIRRVLNYSTFWIVFGLRAIG